MEHIDKRSVDGSESKFTQWELELQASIEKLNHLSVGNPLLVRKRDAQSSSDLRSTVDGMANNFLSAEIWQSLSQFPRSTKDPKTFEKNELVNSSPPHLQRSYSMINSMITLQGTSMFASTSNTTKSLNSSPVNRSASNFENRNIAEKAGSADMLKYVPNRICQFDIKNKKAQSSWSINDYSNHDINAMSEEQEKNKYSNINDSLTNTSHVQPMNLSTTPDSFNIKFLPPEPNLSEGHSFDSENNSLTFPGISQHLMSSQNDITRLQTQFSSNTLQKNRSCSANSSPMKLKNLLISSAKSSNSENAGRCAEESIPKQFARKTKELPLLSLFGPTSALSAIKGKSCSMIDLDDKQNLKTLLDNSHLGNMQAISAEKLANVRPKLVNNYPETKTDDIKK